MTVGHFALTINRQGQGDDDLHHAPDPQGTAGG